MTLLDSLERADAGAIAVVDDVESITYGELRRQARQIATVLSLERRGACVVIHATPTVRFVATMVGAMYSGNVAVPIDPDLPQAGVDFIAAKSGATAVMRPLQHHEFADACPSDQRDAALPALILFTSGTTGRPKGVVVSYANLRHSCRTISAYLGYQRHPSAAVALPLHYSYALVSQVCCQLSIGGRVRLFHGLRHPGRFSDAVNTEGLETFCGVPSTFHALSVFHAMGRLVMPSVRVLCSAGAPMDRTRLSTLREMFPNATVFNNYGMTEAAPRIAYVRDDDPRFDQPTCGRPIDGVDVKIVHPDTLRDLPDGEPGLLVVRGPNVTSGYINDPELTAQAFTPDGYLKSGDVAHLDDGYIYIRGRLDEMFNSGGEKVAPREIELVLDRIDGVEMSAVGAADDEHRGAVPVAFVKLARDLSRRELVAPLVRALTPAKVPVRYFEVRAFPMTANGKLQRTRLSPDANYVIRELR
jgi:acyl-CoA synthetase (AMP-forming)/AMP-acid ligase II